jgi:hypothetical protein
MNIDPNTKRFIFDRLKWIGIYTSISFLVLFLLPFPYNLISIFGLYILVTYLRVRSLRKKYRGTGGGIKDMLSSLSSPVSGNNQQKPRKYS